MINQNKLTQYSSLVRRAGIIALVVLVVTLAALYALSRQDNSTSRNQTLVPSASPINQNNSNLETSQIFQETANNTTIETQSNLSISLPKEYLPLSERLANTNYQNDIYAVRKLNNDGNEFIRVHKTKNGGYLNLEEYLDLEISKIKSPVNRIYGKNASLIYSRPVLTVEYSTDNPLQFTIRSALYSEQTIYEFVITRDITPSDDRATLTQEMELIRNSLITRINFRSETDLLMVNDQREVELHQENLEILRRYAR